MPRKRRTLPAILIPGEERPQREQAEVAGAIRIDNRLDPSIPSFQFGHWYLELAARQSSNRFCPPLGSRSHFNRADTSVELTYWVTRPGTNHEVRVVRPAGAADIEVGKFACMRIQAGPTKLAITITITKDPIE